MYEETIFKCGIKYSFIIALKDVRRFNVIINLVAYRLPLSAKLARVYNAFHISQLRKYVPCPNHDIVLDIIEVTKNLVYDKCFVYILDYRVKQLHNKSIPLVKIL